MQCTITPQGMKELESEYMAQFGVPSALLMEHAAQGVVQAIQRHAAPKSTVLFLCGPGNNGGDGYAAARLWQAGGGRSHVLELSSQPGADALLQRTLALHAGVSVEAWRADLADFLLPACSAIVDALFGTGLSRAMEGPAANAVHWVNQQRLPIIAVDIPSGLDGLNGTIPGTEAVKATETVTFHRVKQGLLLGQGPCHTGRLTTHPILIPEHYGKEDGFWLLSPNDMPVFTSPRPFDCQKGDFGRIVIFAGSPGMCGAAAFCAAACVKAGAGLTTILCRASILPTLQALVPEAMCIPLPEENDALLPQAADIVRRALERADAAIVGCGLGQGADLLPVLRVFQAAHCSVVWDADALNLLAQNKDWLPLRPTHIITPHAGEAARLLACSISDVLRDPVAQLAALQRQCGCTVLLKGAYSLISDGGRTFINTCGSPALAKGGSGDVLSGVIGALLGRKEQCLPPLEAAALGALLHGLAGQRAACSVGENNCTPQLLIQFLRTDSAAWPQVNSVR